MKARQFQEHTEAFRAFNRSKGLSPRTVQIYEAGLRQFLGWFIGEFGEQGEVTAQRLRQFIAARLEKGNKPSTVRTYRDGLQAFYSYLVLDELIPELENPMRRVPKVRFRAPQIEPLSPQQVTQFLATFDKSKLREYRDFTICVLVLDTGLRAGEVLSLKVEDIDFDRLKIRVMGKGAKSRAVFFGETTSRLLKDYLEHCRPWFANGLATLFPPKSPHAKNPTLPVSQLSAMVKAKMDAIGVKPMHSSTHRLRHTFATQFLRGGGNVFALQKLLGHATLEMTKRYCTLADEDLAEQHRKASPVDAMEF